MNKENITLVHKGFFYFLFQLFVFPFKVIWFTLKFAWKYLSIYLGWFKEYLEWRTKQKNLNKILNRKNYDEEII